MEQVKKTILIYSLVFPPDRVSTAYLYGDIAETLKKNEFEVKVITSTPHYNPQSTHTDKFQKKLFGLYFEGYYNGFKVYQIPQKKSPSIFYRLYQFAFFHFVSLVIGIRLNSIDFVLSVSPPLTLGIFANIIAWFHGAKSAYNVQEIYPDIAIANGSLKNPILIKLVYKVEEIVYKYSDAVITIDSSFSNIIEHRINHPNKLYVIPNFIDLELYRPEDKVNDFSIKHSMSNNFVIGYVGNIGAFQDWKILINTSIILKDQDITFMIVGNGIQKKWIVEQIEKYDINNIKLIPYQERENIKFVNSTAEIHFITMTEASDLNGLPSKLFAIMASKRAIIAACSSNSATAKMLKKSGSGVVTPVNDAKKFAEAILELKASNKELEKFANSGYSYVNKNYSKEVVTKMYVDLISKML